MNEVTILFETSAPVPFGPKHLIGTGVTLLLVALALFLTIVVFPKTNKRTVLKVTTLLLLVMEVFKQTLGIRDTGFQYYPLWALPFQLCSVSIYLMPIVAFGTRKLAVFFAPGCFTIGLLASLAMLSYPSTVLGGTYLWTPLLPDNEFPLISFTYHGAMIFFSLFLLFSKTYLPSYKDFPRAYLTMVGFAVIAILANLVWGTDMMFLNTAYLFPFQFILIQGGRVVYYLFMAVLSFVAMSLPFLPSLFGRKTTMKKTENAVS